MAPYADQPARRARQILGDATVAAWLVICILAGRTVHTAILAAQEPGRRLADVGASVAANMAEAGRQAGSIPLLGERLGLPFEAVAGAGAQARDAGDQLVRVVGDIAFTLGVVVAVVPALLVVVPWLVLRVRYAREAGALRAMLASAEPIDLLALRALAGQPLRRLAAVSASPVRDWRAGTPAVVRALAELELDRWGVRAPRSPGGS
ncbi:hypothetical protein [Georgenia sp. SYP-B2076]|uniref:hypothetical protein n=1 Tax=Georgenia sp. SYP-B2076 TaxID=2495881 RepID=UPI000F8F40AB|nr:hypothetical protein [Georgenia sp. SYP-B2076]